VGGAPKQTIFRGVLSIASLAIAAFSLCPSASGSLLPLTEADLLRAESSEFASHQKRKQNAIELAQRLTYDTAPKIILDLAHLQTQAWIDIGNSNKIQALIDAASTLAQRTGDPMRIATMRHLQARARFFSGDDTAVDDSQRALEAQQSIAATERDHPDPTRLYEQSIDHAYLLQAVARDTELVSTLRAAERLLPLVRNRESNSIALDYLYSSLLLTVGDKDAALARLDSAFARANAIGNTGWLIEILGARAVVHLDSGDAQRAIAEAEIYEARAREDGNMLANSHAKLHLAEAHALLGKLDTAQAFALAALNQFDGLDDNFDKANARRELARISALNGKWKDATRLLHEAQRLRPETASENWAYKLAMVRTSIALASGDVAAATRAKADEDARAMKRQAKMSAEQLKALRAYYEVTERELKMQLLERENDIARRDRERDEGRIFVQRLAIGAASVLLLLIGLVAVLLYRRSRVLRKIADTDALTGVLSRAAILEHARRCITAAGTEQPTAVCLFDIDGFKAVNDQMGHAAGDRALKDAVAVIKQLLRRDDLLGRLGGDEFLLVMPGASESVAAHTAERIVESLAERKVSFGKNRTLTLTMSAGIASTSHVAIRKLEQLVFAADNALLTAKRSGRNRVVCASDVAATPIIDSTFAKTSA
jgi:diguanylate cyclase (GGDEF)-like protein